MGRNAKEIKVTLGKADDVFAHFHHYDTISVNKNTPNDEVTSNDMAERVQPLKPTLGAFRCHSISSQPGTVPA